MVEKSPSNRSNHPSARKPIDGLVHVRQSVEEWLDDHQDDPVTSDIEVEARENPVNPNDPPDAIKPELGQLEAEAAQMELDAGRSKEEAMRELSDSRGQQAV